MKIYLTLLFITLQWYLHAQNIVINEIYGGGGISGAVYTNDFVELYNNGSTSVSLTGYSVQYASAAGSNWSSVALNGTIYPQGYYLVQLASSGAVGQALPTPDATGTINMNSSTGGKVALVNLTTAMPSSTCPTGPVILDLVGYGTSGCFWGTSSAPSPSAVNSIERQLPGQNSLQNGVDFKAGSPTPRGASRISQSITFDPLISRTYGDPGFNLTAISSSGLPISFTSSNPNVASVNSNNIAIVSAGQTDITASQSGDTTYAAAADQSQTLVITKAVLQAFADNKSMTAGESLPSFTISFAGFKGSDNASLIDTLPLATTTATTSSPPGDYAINLSAGLDNNYDFSLASGILTILDPATLPDVHITNPPDGALAVGVTLKATTKILTGAATYVIQLSPLSDFSSAVIEKSGARTQQFSGLSYGTQYFLRVKTNLSDVYGKKTSFTTGPPEQFTFIASPAHNAIRVGVNPALASATIIGATTYTIELSSTSDFSESIVTKTGSRSQVFQGLSLSTRYYTRVKTDLSDNWGPTKSFTTGDAVSLSYVTVPANNAVNISWLPTITVNNINAQSYSLQICKLDSFNDGVIELTSATNRFTVSEFLSYNTRYFTRVRSNLTSEWGVVRSFTTGNPVSFAFVSSPPNDAVNQNYGLKVTSNLVPGASNYIIELNTDSDFNPSSATTQSSGVRAIKFDLLPNTRYFSRVKTDLSPESWGATRSFTTGEPLSLAFVVSPADGVQNVNIITKVTTNAIPGASNYTIELNTSSEFTGASLVASSAKPSITFTLTESTTYFSRVMTNLENEWGSTIKSFTTGTPQSLAYVVSPKNGGTGAPLDLKVYANAVGGASAYTIELNPTPDFSASGVTQVSSSRIIDFTGLTPSTTYYTRVQTNLAAGLWGQVQHFTTASSVSAGRFRGNWEGDTTDDEVRTNAIGPSIYPYLTTYPNPFSSFFNLIVKGADGSVFSFIITNQFGDVIEQGQIPGGESRVFGEFWPDGLYIVKVWQGFRVMNQRMVKVGSGTKN